MPDGHLDEEKEYLGVEDLLTLSELLKAKKFF